jgi:hypothetical protein
MTTEQTFYSDDKGVRITGTRAIFNLESATGSATVSTTYSMANITSVKQVKERAKRKPGILVAILGIVLLVAGVIVDITELTITGSIIGALGILLAYVAKGVYELTITSASGESTPISSKEDKDIDEKYIGDIAMAINEAMIRRG